MKYTKAIIEYRSLPANEKTAFNPDCRPGAAHIRRLQEIAHAIATKSRCDVIAQFGNNPPLQREIYQKEYLVPLGWRHAKEVADAAKARYPRRRNFEYPEAVLRGTETGEVVAKSFSYRGSKRGFIGHKYHPVMRSICRISADGKLLYAIIGHSGDERHYSIPAGRGYRWDADANGVRLIRLRDGADFHPSSDDIRLGRRHIIAALRERAAARKAAEMRARRETKEIEEAAKGGVYVCLQDSIDGGNCLAGTTSYARRHGLDIRRHYLASELPMESDPYIRRRIALAVLAAKRRQARELKAGFCELS